jgi:hypothetical protein
MPSATQEDDGERVLAAMRSGEWLRTQWIARVAFGLGTLAWDPQCGQRAVCALRRAESAGQIERRSSTVPRAAEIAGLAIWFSIPRAEWRMRR